MTAVTIAEPEASEPAEPGIVVAELAEIPEPAELGIVVAELAEVPEPEVFENSVEVPADIAYPVAAFVAALAHSSAADS